MLRCKDPQDYFVWSSYSILNQAEFSKLKIPIIEVQKTDENDDGIIDKVLNSCFLILLKILEDSVVLIDIFLFIIIYYYYFYYYFGNNRNKISK